jgi:hypothetical protein
MKTRSEGVTVPRGFLAREHRDLTRGTAEITAREHEIRRQLETARHARAVAQAAATERHHRETRRRNVARRAHPVGPT